MHIVKDSGEMDFVNVHMITKGDVSHYLIQKLTDTAYQNVKDGTPNGLRRTINVATYYNQTF